MINICRKHGERVYSDAFINHNAGNGNFMYIDHRNNAGSCVHLGPKVGSVDSPWWNTCWQFKDNDLMEKDQSLNFLLYPMFYLASIVKGIKIH